MNLPMSIESAISRRGFTKSLAGTLGGVALTDLLATDGVLSGTHHPARAKRVVQLFMAGAASHVDLFDYKPQLEKEQGQQWDPGEEVELFQSSPGVSQQSYWKFERYGQSGKQLSEPVSALGKHVDDIAFVHNVVGQTGVHSQGTLLQTTGFNRPGFPSAGSWVSYALGSENENLPSFVVLPDHRGFASNGVKNWSSMFLPAQHQGTVIRPGSETPINDLYRPDTITQKADTDALAALRALNEKHAAARAGDSRLQARIRSYELAAQMQLSATEALNVSKEPQYIKDLYGLAPEGPGVADPEINRKAEAEFFGRKCLVARRLLERGVRFVQIFSGNENGFPRRNWDSHED
ncbi:MAG: DUF1501 domain-containing protein, partial [Verrucomicrobiales bacterium]|nr:DUF1501 domain-containing protein [Verrucomicrobiales bacterium]